MSKIIFIIMFRVLTSFIAQVVEVPDEIVVLDELYTEIEEYDDEYERLMEKDVFFDEEEETGIVICIGEFREHDIYNIAFATEDVYFYIAADENYDIIAWYAEER